MSSKQEGDARSHNWGNEDRHSDTYSLDRVGHPMNDSRDNGHSQKGSAIHPLLLDQIKR